jgi:hypothetical protein
MINATNPSTSSNNLPPTSLEQEQTATTDGTNAPATNVTQSSGANALSDQGISAQDYNANFSTTRDTTGTNNNKMLMIDPGKVNPNANRESVQGQMVSTPKANDAGSATTNGTLTAQATPNPRPGPAPPQSMVLSNTVNSKLNAAGLTPAQKEKAVGILVQFASTPSYRQITANETNGSGQKGGKQFIDNYFTGTVISAVKNPNNTPLNNTVTAIASGKIKIETENTLDPNGSITFGHAGSNSISMNMHPQGGIPAATKGNVQRQFNTTLIHEVNHYLNDLRVPNKAANNADRFWNEYRAKFVGYVGGGMNPTNVNKRVILDVLIGKNAGYPDLQALYQADPKLKKVIDTALNQNKNATFSVNDMRQALINAGYKTPYIMQSTNTDNNLRDLR